MEEMIEGLITKTGIDRATAEKVVDYLKENSDKIPGWLGLDLDALKGKLPGGLGSLLG
jgi:hypothetical protein